MWLPLMYTYKLQCRRLRWDNNAKAKMRREENKLVIMHETVEGKGPVTIHHKSHGDRRIFAGCLFFEIGSSSADFLDLEPCRKVSQRAPDGRLRETVRPLADFIL